MRRDVKHLPAFTLMELILVMAILTVIVAVIAPQLGAFANGRKVNYVATNILSMCRFARAQSAIDGCVYRLNVNAEARTLTVSKDMGGGQFQVVPGDLSRYQLPDGVNLVFNISAAATSQLVMGDLAEAQQTPQQQPPPLGISGTMQTPGQLMVNARDDTAGTYIAFQPTGWADPVEFTLTDIMGRTIRLEADTPTDPIRILSDQETSQR